MTVARLPIVFNLPVFPMPPVLAVPGLLPQGGMVNGHLNASLNKPLRATPQPLTFKRPEKSHPLNGLNLKGTNPKVIGAGISGEVCRYTINGKDYIVKSMNGETERTMFEKEVFAFRKLKPHGNICAPVAFSFVNGKPAMLFEAHTLPTTSIAERAASLPPGDQLAVMEVYVRDLLRGLSAMHGEEIAHGDVKSANTIFDPETLQFKVIDLGHTTVASAADPRTGGEVLRHRSGRSGDLRYTSPELGHPERGNKTLRAQETLQAIDVFAVGRILQDWIAHADKRFEDVNGGKPSAELAARNPDVAKWMERRKRLGEVAVQMLDNDPGKRPVVKAALDALTPSSPTDRVQGRKVLGQLMATVKADKADTPATSRKP